MVRFHDEYRNDNLERMLKEAIIDLSEACTTLCAVCAYGSLEYLALKKKLRGLSPQARTIPTERPPLVGEVSANFSG
jgi:hypothetical protein